MNLSEHTLSSVTLALESVWESCKIAVETFPDEEREATYRQVRNWLKEYPTVFSRCPETLKTCVDLAAVRRSLKDYSPHYAPRRDFVDREFDDAIDAITILLQDPISDIDALLVDLDSQTSRLNWDKTKQRIRNGDYDGAITSSKSFLESVLKKILHDADTPSEGNEDLPQLWRKVGKNMNLLPESHDEQQYKIVLGNMQSAVNGIANIRNSMGDAHGPNPTAPRPAKRHAELVANLTAAMVQYLIEARIPQNKLNA